METYTPLSKARAELRKRFDKQKDERDWVKYLNEAESKTITKNQ